MHGGPYAVANLRGGGERSHRQTTGGHVCARMDCKRNIATPELPGLMKSTVFSCLLILQTIGIDGANCRGGAGDDSHSLVRLIYCGPFSTENRPISRRLVQITWNTTRLPRSSCDAPDASAPTDPNLLLFPSQQADFSLTSNALICWLRL